ncbi:GH92 family glycosyl hydrolase [Oleiagrimonas sp. C23AA]|uniref:GH92 family glycosyl hydrolase n=1 Tax=Oleiagrimonas sp. C23AA TaxID=2719047 RepID=UPI001420E12D|nr:GH92 family glycosyl hydrolase [Oleiagrimonas sp. C23AA]NII09273.1 glycoside hydrolase family 92 protein [Oleiagrimonas sp. C23AA]
MGHQNATSRSRLPSMRKLAAATSLCLLAAAIAPTPAVAANTSSGPASLVDTFLGTGNGGAVTGNVNTFPGATMPFGMLTFSPTTPSRPPGSDYAYKDHRIEGFSLTHLSGPGCWAGGVVPILPTSGKVPSQPQKASEPFSHQHESAHPGRYQVTLAPGSDHAIEATLAATTRTGISTFHFPADAQANVLFKAADAASRTGAGSIHVIGDHALAGSVTSGYFCGTQTSDTTYFVVQFKRPFRSFGTWEGNVSSKDSRSAAGAGSAGAWVSFDTRHNRDVQMKVAISYVSTANAWANLKAEDDGWSTQAVADKAQHAWNKLLSRIDVHGGTHDQKVQFYTGLYHVLVDPNVFSDANGQYIGYDRKIHQLPKGQHTQYANFSGWDIYRSEMPLLALLAPKRSSDMVRSLLNDQAQGGWLPKWGYDNVYTGVMNGDAADPVIADAYAFGARDFDHSKALKAMLHGATHTPDPSSWSGGYVERPNLHDYERLGYVPGNASETLEYATADFSIAAFAKALGDTQTTDKFLKRAGNWRNTFDKQAKFRGFAGYSEPRNVDGSYPADAGFGVHNGAYGQSGFEEGNTLQYTWMVPQDMHGLIGAMGGNATAQKRLDTLFQQLNVGPNKPYYWAGNEPGLNMPWAYDYAGAPYKTQQVVHRLLEQVYSDKPGGEPGNDDLGAMSSWLVWSYLGMYPDSPGAPVLTLGAPVFPRITLHMGNGHTVTIHAPKASMKTYVNALKVNGKPWHKAWLPASLLTGGQQPSGQDTLDFDMRGTPNKQWAAAASDAPPSYPPADSAGGR